MIATPSPLILLGEPRPQLPLVAQEPVVSPITGRDLRRSALSIQMLRGDESDQFAAEIQAAANGRKLLEDSDHVHWKVENYNYSWEGEGKVVTHNLQLVEHEDIVVEGLEFEGITISPSRANPALAEGELASVTIQFELDATQHDRFESILRLHYAGAGDYQYFEVQLTGTLERSLLMRFGQCVWQSTDSDVFRHVITLVAKTTDDAQTGSGLQTLFEPTRARLIERAITERHRMDALLSALCDAGVLNVETIAEINQVEGSFADHRAFHRADDVDPFFS